MYQNINNKTSSIIIYNTQPFAFTRILTEILIQ